MARFITDSKMKYRDRLSFLLYVSLAFVSISLCCIISVANPNTLLEAFTDSDTVESLRADVSQYTEDMCLKNNIPDDFVSQAVTYDDMYTLETVYVSGALDASNQYTDASFDIYLNDFTDALQKKVVKSLQQNGINDVSDESVRAFCEDISDYASSRIDVSCMNSVKYSIKRIRIISYLLVAVFCVCAVISVALILTGGGKKYRAVRSISYSVLGASLINFVVLIGIKIVEATKDLVIYPLYIADAFIKYVDMSCGAFFVGAVSSLAVFLTLVAVSWKLKRNEKD